MVDPETDQSNKPKQAPEVQRLSVDYIKSNFFRVVHADGVWGAANPENIEIVFWNTRPAIPQRLNLVVSSEGDVREEGAVTRADLVRETEVAVIMSLDIAADFHKWLGEKIDAAKPLRGKAKEKPDADKSQA